MSAADDMDREEEAPGGEAERPAAAEEAARKDSAEEQTAAGEPAQPAASERPALPPVMLPWSTLPTWPTVARQLSSTRRISPDGRRRVA